MTKPAPAPLETVRAFVNTLDLDAGTELLATPDDLRGWLAGQGLLDGGVQAPAGAADLRNAIELREALRAHLLSHHGEPVDPHAVAALDAAARRARLQLRFTGADDTALAPAAGGIDGALGRLLAIVAAAIADGTWRRLKACPDDTCQFAFYDASRNRSAVWCDMSECGNRAKVRAYRKRARASGETG